MIAGDSCFSSSFREVIYGGGVFYRQFMAMTDVSVLSLRSNLIIDMFVCAFVCVCLYIIYRPI